MKKLVYLIVLTTLVACGQKQAITYKEYQQAHEQIRERHIQIIQSDMEVFDTLCTQDIQYIKVKKFDDNKINREFILDCWKLTSDYLREMNITHQIYSHAVIMNDSTHYPVMKMWSAQSELRHAEATMIHDIHMTLKYDENMEPAIPLIENLQKKVKKEMGLMLEGAQEYHKIVFEQK